MLCVYSMKMHAMPLDGDRHKYLTLSTSLCETYDFCIALCQFLGIRFDRMFKTNVKFREGIQKCLFLIFLPCNNIGTIIMLFVECSTRNKLSYWYSGTLPYDHPVNTDSHLVIIIATSLSWKLYSGLKESSVSHSLI